jgi:hypothetical protein
MCGQINRPRKTIRTGWLQAPEWVLYCSNPDPMSIWSYTNTFAIETSFEAVDLPGLKLYFPFL